MSTSKNKYKPLGKDSEQKPTLIKSWQGLDTFIRKAKGLVSNLHLFGLTHFVSKFAANLTWLALAGTLVTIPFNLYKLARTALFSKKKMDAYRGGKLAMLIAELGIAFLAVLVIGGAIAIAAPILIVASSAKAVLEGFWTIGKTLFQRHQLKQTLRKQEEAFQASTDDKKRLPPDYWQNKNKLRELNQKLASKTHILVQSAIALAGAALLFTPAAPVGIILLVSVAAYGLADAVNLNPLRWLAQGFLAIFKRNPLPGPVSEPEKEKFTEKLAQAEKPSVSVKDTNTATAKTAGASSTKMIYETTCEATTKNLDDQKEAAAEGEEKAAAEDDEGEGEKKGVAGDEGEGDKKGEGEHPTLHH